MKDMCFLILIFLLRGAKWSKVIGKTNKDMIKVLSHLKDKYNISTVVRDVNTPMGKDVVTLARIVSCFPVRVLQFLEMGVGRIIIDVSSILPGVTVPPWLHHPAAASVMVLRTKFEVIRNLRVLVFGVCVLTDDVLHGNDKKYTPLQTIRSYMEAAMATPAVPQNARTKFLVAVDMYTQTAQDAEGATYAPVSAMCPQIDAPELIERILELRPQDKAKNLIKEWLLDLIKY